jgi:hypothetical protein
VISI